MFVPSSTPRVAGLHLSSLLANDLFRRHEIHITAISYYLGKASLLKVCGEIGVIWRDFWCTTPKPPTKPPQEDERIFSYPTTPC